MLRTTLACLLLAVATVAAVAEPSMGPVIEDYGPTYPVTDRDVALPEDFVYKVAFDVAKYPGDTAATNSRLVSAARFLNMHARNGVAPENMHLALVVHGAAVKNLLSHVAYQKRYDSDNPNLDLLTKLHAAGVRIYVCGQSMRFGGVLQEELAPVTEVALSAMTMLSVLQADDYSVLF